MTEEIIVYKGPDRRQECAKCPHEEIIKSLRVSVDVLTEEIGSGTDKFQSCKNEVDMNIATLHKDMATLRQDVHTMRQDIHSLTNTVAEMNKSLSTIAESIKAIADFPETWTKIKGFWAVIGWIKNNWVVLALLMAGLWFATANTLGSLIH